MVREACRRTADDIECSVAAIAGWAPTNLPDKKAKENYGELLKTLRRRLINQRSDLYEGLKMLPRATGPLGSSLNLARGLHIEQRMYDISTGTGSLELSVMLFSPENFTSNATSEIETPSEHDAMTFTFGPSSCNDLTVHF